MPSTPTILDTALALRDCGIPVIPIGLGKPYKTPALGAWKEFQSRHPADAELKAWFRKRIWNTVDGEITSSAGMAAIGGAVSGGLECLDFDEPGLFERWADDVDQADGTLLGRMVVVRTPAAGVHLWYRCDSVSGNTALASRSSTAEELAANPNKKLQVMIETRGEGGYALLPGSPSQCHELNKPYTYDPAGVGDLTKVGRISPAERQLMHDLAVAYNRVAGRVQAPAPPRDAQPLTDLRPGNDFDVRGYPWREILEPHGWQLVRGDWENDGRVSRPGKDPRDGHSATIGHCRGPNGEALLNVFTSSDASFPKGTYGKFNAWARIHFKGDLGRAASALSRLGFGSPPKSAERNGKHAGGTNGTPEQPAGKPWETKSSSAVPAGFSLAELMAMEFQPPKFAIDGLLSEGLNILAGKPKMGKSWLSLLIAWAVASGQDLDGRKVLGGDVLFLGLEDTARRLQSRVRMLRPAVPWEFPKRLTINNTWLRADQGGLNHIAQWLEERRGSARLVVIDTMAKFRRGRKGGGDAYGEDYEDYGVVKGLSDEFGVSSLVVTHTRKLKSEDPFDDISGTLGIGGAADGILVLERDRSSDDHGRLYVTGRDVSEVTIPLTLDKATWRWTLGASVDGIDIASRTAASPASNKVELCCRWITEFLAEYAHPANEMEAAAKIAGYSPSAIRDAKTKLGRNGSGIICFEKNGSDEWWVGLTPKSDWKRRPYDPKPKTKKGPESSESSESLSGRQSGRPESLNSPVNSPAGSESSTDDDIPDVWRFSKGT